MGSGTLELNPWLRRAGDVAHAFGLGRPRRCEPLTGGGSTSTLMRVETEDGTWVVKETRLRSRGARVRMEDGFEFESALAAAGVPLPRPMPLSDGRRGVWVRIAESGERFAVTVREFVRGEPVGYLEPLEVCTPTALALATALGRAHQIAWRPRVPHGGGRWPSRRSWKALRDKAVRRRCPAEPVLGALWPMLDFAESVVRAGRPTGRAAAPVHADANPHNVLRTSDGICIVDWSDGEMGDPQSELASALIVWGCDADGRPRDDLPTRMVRAYRETGAPFEPTDLTIFLTHLHAMVKWAFSLGQIAVGDRPDDPRSPQWAIAALHESVLAWEPRWHRLPELLDHVREA